jgi:hypothetical protein
MEPSDEEKERMAANGTPYNRTPTRALLDAAGTYLAGGDPIDAVVKTLPETNSLRNGLALLSGQSVRKMRT